MNTIRSVGYGWAVLIVAGAGSYYFAKKDIDKDRIARATKRQNEKYLAEAMVQEPAPGAMGTRNRNITPPDHVPQQPGNQNKQGRDGQLGIAEAVRDAANSPSQEASEEDPAPTRHAPENEEQRIEEKSKYAASEVFRSRKGDRLW